jgi:hypothetical protein
VNDHRATARALKAEAIASTYLHLCRAGNITPTLEGLDAIDDRTRELLTHAAHQKPASSETWKVVRAIVERRLTAPPRDATVDLDGPMDGH